MTTRRWMIAIAILAPILAAGVWLDRFNRSLHHAVTAFNSQDLLSSEYVAASELLERGSYIAAEARYRSALSYADELRDLGDTPSVFGRGLILLGLADALAGQGRAAEAESLFRDEASNSERSGLNDDEIAELLECYATFLRRSGRETEAIASEDQALAILDRSSASLRRDGRESEAMHVESRAAAIRAARTESNAVP